MRAQSRQNYYETLNKALKELYAIDNSQLTIDNGGETVDCQLSTVNLIHVDFDDDFDDSYYEQAAEQIYDNGGYNPEMLSTPKGSALINETYRAFTTAIDKGLGEEPDPAVSSALRENAFVFSGFKTHAELEQVSQMLVDKDGNIKSFHDFMKEVDALGKDYNHNYLRSEYNQAVQAAQMAAKWQNFEKNKDFINLQYRTANDERVRASHRILHGTTLPVDDPFWDKYTPPNGWGCRCTVVEVLKEDYPEQDSHGSIAKAETLFQDKKSQMFKTNPGKTLKVFPDKHPYLPKGCGECGKTLLAYNPNRLICKACGAIRKLFKKECESKKVYDKAQRIAENKKEYERYKNDPEYLNVEFNEKTGGLKATHKDRKKHKHEKTPLGLTPTELEDVCQDNVFKMGGSCIIQNEKTKRPDGSFATSLDAKINGKLMDIRSVCTPTTKIVNSLTDKHKQLISYYKDTNKKASALCLYYHIPTWYKKELIEKAIISYKKICKARGEIPAIKELVIILNGHHSPIEIEI